MDQLASKLYEKSSDYFRIYYPKGRREYIDWAYKAASASYSYLAKQIFDCSSTPFVDIYLVDKKLWKLTKSPNTHPYGMIYTVTDKDWARAIFVPTTLPSYFWNHSGIDWRGWLFVMWHEMTHVLFIYHNVICRKPLWFWEGLATLGAICCYYNLDKNSDLYKLLKDEVGISEGKLRERVKTQELVTLRDCSEAFYKRKIKPETYDFFQRILVFMDNELFQIGGEEFVRKLFRTLCSRYQNRKSIPLKAVYELVDSSMPKAFDFERYLKGKWWY